MIDDLYLILSGNLDWRWLQAAESVYSVSVSGAAIRMEGTV